jgi:hypothetical protein
MSGTAWSKVVVNAREQPRKKILLKSPLIRDRIQHGPRTARHIKGRKGSPGVSKAMAKPGAVRVSPHTVGPVLLSPIAEVPAAAG